MRIINGDCLEVLKLYMTTLAQTKKRYEAIQTNKTIALHCMEKGLENREK